jgi:hypothetical protein
VDDLKHDLMQHLTAARDLAAKAEAEGRDLTAEERSTVVKAMDQAKDLKARIDQKQADSEMLQAMLALGENLDTGIVDPSAQRIIKPVSAGKGRTPGLRFVEAPEFKNWMQGAAPNGRIPESAKGLHSPPVQFGGLQALLTGGQRHLGGRPGRARPGRVRGHPLSAAHHPRPGHQRQHRQRRGGVRA